MNEMYHPSIIPTLYSKIGATTVRAEMLEAALQAANERIYDLLKKYEPESLPENGEKVDITLLSEQEQASILAPPAPGPNQEDLLKQLEADFLSAKRDGDTDLMTELDERHDRVKAATNDADALKEYQYRPPAEGDTPAEEAPQQ